VVHARGEREESLEGVGDINLNVSGWHSRVKSGNNHFRQIDGRKEIHRHAHQANQSDYAHGEANDNDEVWIANGKA
jgi:hypothetical protein